MFGAAGAPVTAPAKSATDPMSTASALLSLIAPSAPTTSQGSATPDASVFEGLLASMLGAGATGDTRTGLLSSGAASLIQTGLTASTPSPALRSLLLMNGADLSAMAGEAADALIGGEAGDVAAAFFHAIGSGLEQAGADVDAAPVQPTADMAVTDTPVLAPVVAPPVITPPVVPTPVASTADPVPTGETSAPTPAAVAPEAIPLAAAPSEPAATVVPAPASTVETVDSVITAPAPQPEPSQVPAQASVQTSAQTLTPVATTPLHVEKTKTSRTVDTGPQVRPDVKADLPETPEVRPVEPTAKGAETRPLTQPDEIVTATFATPQRRFLGSMAHARLDDSAMVEVARPLTEGGSTTAPTPETLPPAPVTVDKTAAQPLVQPPISAAVPTAAPIEDEVTAPIETGESLDAAETPDLTDAVQPTVPEAERKAAETPRPVEAPNLRALADRASRTLETNAAVDTAAPSTPVTTTPQAPTAQAPAANAVAAPAASAIEAAVTADASDEAAATDAPVDAAGPEAPPSAQTAHTTREALGSTLSRAAIDATAQIAAQILKKLDGRSTRFEMSLTPDELGRVDVKLEIDAEGRLAARLAFDNPAAATDLKGRVDDLRRQLEQQGFQLTDDALEFTQRDSGSSAFDRGQDSRQGQDGNQSRAFSAASRLNTEADIVAQPPRWQSLSLAPTGVDMKV